MKFFIIFCIIFVLKVDVTFTKSKCATISCVRSTAEILEKMNPKVNPCHDFYQFSCGTFISETFTADEDDKVDTISIMTDQLYEFMLTILDDESQISKNEIFGKVKQFYGTCLDEGET
jgi:predicted metalloendopeptidase